MKKTKQKNPKQIKAEMQQLKEKAADKILQKDLERIRRMEKGHKAFLRFIFTIVYHFKLFLLKNTQDNINALAGQSAFFLILSMVPLLMLILSLLAILGGTANVAMLEKEAQEALAERIAQLGASPALSDAIYQFIYNAYVNATSGVVIVTAVTALWSSGKGMYIITDGISRIYRLPQKRPWLLRRIFAMGYTVVVLLMMVLCFGMLFVSATAELYFAQATDGIPLVAEILYTLRYVISTVILTLFLTMALKLYLLRKVKNKRYTKFRVLLPGMLFTTVAWNVLTWGVSLYSRYFTNSLYGSLSTVFIVMMWIYFMMLLLLYGVQIDFMYCERFYNFSLIKAIKKLFSKKSQKNTQVGP